MTSAVQRHMRVTYGSLTMGDNTDYLLDGPILLQEGDNEFTATWTFVYAVPPGDGTPEATFETEVATIESALRQRQQALLVEYGADLAGTPRTRISLSPADKTGLATRAEWVALREETHTIRSVRYEVTVTGKLPADNETGLNGRREWRYRVDLDGADLATVTFSGVFTAWPGPPARTATAQYQNQISGEVNSVLGSLFPSEVFQLESETYTPDDDDEEVTFERRYVQLIDRESADVSESVLDDPRFKEQRLVITRSRADSRDPFGVATPLVQLSASFSTRVPINYPNGSGNSGNNRGLDKLRELVDGTLVPWIAQRMQEVAAGRTVALVSVQPDFDPRTNTLTIAVGGLTSAGGNVLDRVMSCNENEQSNEILRKLYPNGSEQPLPVPPNANSFGTARVPVPRAFRFRTAGTVRRTVTDTIAVMQLNTACVSSPSSASGGAGSSGSSSTIPVGIGVGGRFNLEGPFQNFLGVGVISDVGEVGFSFTSPDGSGGGGGGGGGGGRGGGGGAAAVVMDRTFNVTPSLRGIPSLGATIPVTEITSVVVLEFYEPAAVGGGGDPAGRLRTQVSGAGDSAVPGNAGGSGSKEPGA